MKASISSISAVITRTRTRVFYGWYIVAAYVVQNFFIGGIVTKGLTALVNPIASTFGWSYAEISLAMSLRSLETGAISPFLGRIVDRYSAKWLILIGIIVEAIGYFMLSQTRNLPMLYVSLLVAALGTSLATNMAPVATLARWFKKNIGKVNGIVSTGIGLGGYGVPLLVLLIDAYGWRTTLVIISAMIAIVGIPLAFVFRNQPEDYGLLPDGAKPGDEKDSQKAQTGDFNLNVKQALRMRALWQLGFAQMFLFAGVGAVTLHIMPYLVSPTVGLSTAKAAMVAMLYLIVGVPARFIGGWLGDIFQKRYISGVAVTLMAIGLFFFAGIKADSFWMAVIFIIIFGIGFGAVNPLRAALVREYFGSRSFGSIFGLQQIFMTAASVSTPVLAGWIFDKRGTYDPIWLILAFVTMVGAALMFTMPAPPKGAPSLT